MTVKRSSKEGRWADRPSARVRFGIEAAFLLLVAGGAVWAKLNPLQIILLMLAACVLVSLIERASSRAQARPTRVARETPAPQAVAAERRWSWKRRREEPSEPAFDPAARLEEHPAPTHDRRLEPEPEASELDAELTQLLAAEPLAPGPTVTKRALELPGLEEPEPPPAEPERPAPERVQKAPPPPPPAEPVAESHPPPPPRPAPREWNLWDLERLARDRAGDTARSEEWTALFVHLRQFANAEGQLPEEFDGLVRESFAELIPAA